jgi:hypothetical protein
LRQYYRYVNKLHDLVQKVTTEGAGSVDAVQLATALDGEAHAALRRLVPIDQLRASGAFFTSAALARLAWQPLLATLNSQSTIADPACGAGSLLLPALSHLAANRFLTSDISQRIRGCDPVGPFVKAARARLFLAVASAPQITDSSISLASVRFSDIRVGDAFSRMRSMVGTASHVAINPPFTSTTAVHTWGEGAVNSAAIFTEVCLKSMRPGARMVAILPDVLRSGTRYRRWRESIESIATVDRMTEWGQFDSETDVHVFVAYLTKVTTHIDVPRASSMRISPLPSEPSTTQRQPKVSTFFDVSVGAVVPHRHPEIGPLVPFATARDLPPWHVVNEIVSKRAFSGTCVTPPFVAVRRTSRPGQSPRAIASIVAGDTDVAVDNHLIVLSPKDRAESTCLQLLSLLRRKSTTEWLDSHFQCRHLPVTALLTLPWE